MKAHKVEGILTMLSPLLFLLAVVVVKLACGISWGDALGYCFFGTLGIVVVMVVVAFGYITYKEGPF